MAERRGGGAGFLWFTVGFLAGVLVTLMGMVLLNGRHTGPSEPIAPTETVTPAPQVRPPHHAAAPPPEPAPEPPASAAPASAAPIDPQVAEDAAAAGMTSRTPREPSGQ